MDLKDPIQEIALQFPGCRCRRMTMELQNGGYADNHKRFIVGIHPTPQDSKSVLQGKNARSLTCPLKVCPRSLNQKGIIQSR